MIRDSAEAQIEAAEISEALADHIQGLGYVVTRTERGFSISAATPPITTSRQIAVYRTNPYGGFAWGWVETRAGTSRTDFHHLGEFVERLTRTHPRKAN